MSGIGTKNRMYRTRISRGIQSAIELASVSVVLVGLAVTIGWIIDISVLKSIMPESVTMKFSTSVSFAFTGISTLLISKIAMQPKRYSNLSQILLPISMLVILLFMITHTASIILNAPSGLDNLFVKEGSDPVQTASPGRPSVPTIISFLLVVAASAGTMFTLSQAKLKRLLRGTGLAVAVIGAIAITGYVLSIPILYYAVEGVNTAMAMHTAILFVAAGTVLVMSARNGFPQKIETLTPAKNSSKSALSCGSDYKTISLRIKFVSLFLAISMIPIFFIGGVSSNNSKTYSPAVLETSIAILGMATAVSVTFFALVISKSILQPIISLRNAARRITAGELDVNISTQTGDEIGDLASDFANMKESVVSTNRNLERLIELRTLELEEANKRLVLANRQLNIANEQLMKQEKMMHDFINVAAHELKSPITPILAATSLLEHRAEERQIRLSEDEFNMIVRNAKRLKQLAEDILDVTRIDSNFLVLQKESIDLNEFVSSIIKDFEVEIRDTKGGRIELLFVSEGDIQVDADKERISQVLHNLLGNAIKFTEDGSIVITVRKDLSVSNVILAIKDTGRGIDLEMQPKLFMKFSTKSFKGTGLGLYISRNIVEAHGGKIWAENNKDGKGATFSFTLPLGSAHQMT